MSEVTFEPFQKVLVRDTDKDKWRTNWYSHLEKDESVPAHVCVGHKWIQCIPYEGNEHLLGTTDSPTAPEPEFKWGDKVEVRNFLDNDWQPAIYCAYGPNCFLCVTKGSEFVHDWRFCRHADW